MLSRRSALRTIAGLGLVACDSRKPQRGILGLGERANERVQAAILGDHEVAAGDITPADKFPVYHVAPGVPTASEGWRLLVTGEVPHEHADQPPVLTTARRYVFTGSRSPATTAKT
ncbi:hypothetical protein BH11MYX1_BH11MYX1_29070 [soil metagenome]